ncbi:MAG: hypothetical protein GY804_14545 [Alphaproteobacteria bacterium]|nr:hypothetical protein [Alphaproteobacteria bacterium]
MLCTILVYPIIFSNVPQLLAVVIAIKIFGFRLFYKFEEVEKRSRAITLFSRTFASIWWILLITTSTLGIITWTKINPDINSEIKTFLASAPSKIPEDNNAAYAFLGMHAPLGTEDTYEWGKIAHKKLENAMFNSNIDKTKIAEEFIKFKDEKNVIRKIAKDLKNNTNHEQNRSLINELGKANKETIKRYLDIYKYTKLSGNLHYGDNAIVTQRYILTDAVYKAMDDNANEAFEIWLNNYRVHKNFIGSVGEEITRSIVHVNVSISLQYLNYLLLYAPSLASDRYDEIKHAIVPLGMKDWKPENYILGAFTTLNNKIIPELNSSNLQNIENETRGKYREYPTALMFCLYDPIVAKNMGFEIAKQRLHLSTLKAVDAIKYEKVIFNNFNFTLWESFYGLPICNGRTLLNLVFDGLVRGTELITAMHTKNAQMRALNVLLDIKAQNIPREQVGDFIKNVSPEYYDPFTEKPIIWDEKQASMFVACEKVEKDNKWNKPNYKDQKCKEIKVYLD